MKEELNVDKIHVTYKNTPYWTAKEFKENLPKLNNPLIQFYLHLLFILSGRPGEPAGIQMDCINLDDKWIHIKQSLTRAKINRIERTDPKKIIFMFPKAKEDSQSVLFLKCTKTAKSVRTIMITNQLMSGVVERMEHINACKKFYEENYNDYNLLICQDNGKPYDPRMLQKLFNKCQVKAGIENIITLRGIRKSSLIYKTNITGNDYMLVMKDSGHTQVQTLIKHYDVTTEECSKVADKIQNDLYQPQEKSKPRKCQTNCIASSLKNS